MDKILFTGPWVREPGYLPNRVVLHASYHENVLIEYIVHTQIDDEGKKSYWQGYYFPIYSYKKEALSKAMARFWEKCQTKYATDQYLVA